MRLELRKFDVELPDSVSLALVISGGLGPDDQRHTGFVIRNMVGEVFLFHLAGNNRYKKDAVDFSFNYLVVPYLEPEVEIPIISFLCLLYADTSGNVKYSIEYRDVEYIGPDNKLVCRDPGDGFTCATFVLETLRRYGLDLVDRATWPRLKEDAVWQDRIVHIARLSNEQFIAQVKSVGKYPRFRPEQALGAAHHYIGAKLPFGVVQPAALEVVREMASLRG